MRKNTRLLFISIVLVLSTGSVYAQNATLSLSTERELYRVGDEIPVTVLLDTDGHETAGTDLSVSFSQETLKLTSIAPGELYSTYPVYDFNNNDGVSLVSGVVQPGETYKGNGVFATLYFEARRPGEGTVVIEHEVNNRNDSNIASTDGKDILGTAHSVEINIANKGFWAKILEFVNGLFRKK